MEPIERADGVVPIENTRDPSNNVDLFDLRPLVVSVINISNDIDRRIGAAVLMGKCRPGTQSISPLAD